MKRLILALLLAAAWSQSAFADGRVLSVAPPHQEELKEPAKPSKKPAAKKETKKVAAPAHQAKAMEPVNGKNGMAEKKPMAEMPKMAEPAQVALPKQVAKMEQKAKQQRESGGFIYVHFDSKPSNAEVVVDGYYAGSTPLQIPVKSGNHDVKIIYPGFSEWARKVNAYKGMRLMALLEEKKEAPVPVAAVVVPAAPAAAAAPAAPPAP